MSSLCLGRRDRSGQAGNDTFYLPSCNLLVRRQAFAASRGFREELHVGEDVDLTWRLRDAGGKIVYTPRGRVFHEHRSRLWPFLRRRFQYGTSEGLLQLLHPERRKKMVLPVALAAAAALAVLSFLTRSWPFVAVGAGVLLVDAARLSAKLRRERLRLPFRSILAARLRACASLVYYLSFHLTRYYAPALIIAGFALASARLTLRDPGGVVRRRRSRRGRPPFDSRRSSACISPSTCPTAQACSGGACGRAPSAAIGR